MNQSQRTKAKFNAAVRTLRETGRKFNIHDVLADIELAEIAAANTTATAMAASQSVSFAGALKAS